VELELVGELALDDLASDEGTEPNPEVGEHVFRFPFRFDKRVA